MTLPRPRFTYQEYSKLPDDQRYEVLEGELVMTPGPNPNHQEVVVLLTTLLHPFARKHGLGKVYVAPVDVILSDHNVVQPDLLFISQGRLGLVTDRGIVGAPDLVVEILSPSTASHDLDTKRRLYGQYGVLEYWIVDPKARSVEVLTQQGAGLETWQRYKGDATLQSPLLPGLTLQLPEIFPSND